MRISARCDYACKALLALALHWPNNKPMHLQRISKNQDIPMKYLTQILIQLRKMGLVESVRGKQGGYLLAKPPQRISLGELIREVAGPFLPLTSSAAKKNSVFISIWREVEQSIDNILKKVSFADIANKAKGLEKAIIYQI